MITPIEIRQQQFKKGLRGYDKDEVNAFLNTLSQEWERLLEEHKRTKQDLERTQASLDSLKQVESALHKTLLQAEETSKSTVENAKKDAELKLQESEAKAREIVKGAMDERSRIEMQINELVARRNEILQQLKSYLLAQTERLQTFEKQEMKSPHVAPRQESVAPPRVERRPEPQAQVEEPVTAPDPVISVRSESEPKVAASVAATPSEGSKSFFEARVHANAGSPMVDDIVDEL